MRFNRIDIVDFNLSIFFQLNIILTSRALGTKRSDYSIFKKEQLLEQLDNRSLNLNESKSFGNKIKLAIIRFRN